MSKRNLASDERVEAARMKEVAEGLCMQYGHRLTVPSMHMSYYCNCRKNWLNATSDARHSSAVLPKRRDKT